MLVSEMLSGAGEDEETKKQKQKALIDATFKVKNENTEKNNSNGNADGSEDSGDGKYFVCVDSWLSDTNTAANKHNYHLVMAGQSDKMSL